jgi:hypothetical protein
MNYVVVSYVHLRAIDKQEAEAATKAIFADIWNLIPELPEPAVSTVLFDKTGPIHRIETGKKLRRPP